MKITLTKVAASEAAKFPSASWAEYKPGSPNNKDSPPIDYWITGEPLGLPVEGQSIIVLRESRNGVPALGMFQSSTVERVEVIVPKRIYKATTQNSIYIFEINS